jgi:DNA topoisomerase 2-associated protein PAT1
MECLEVCNLSLGEKSDSVDHFLETLLPILSEIVSESPLSVVSSLVQIILERHNLIWVAKSRIGLEILTLFLSKAELLKSADNVDEKELQAWGEVFDFIFKSFESQFTDLFAKNIEPADEEFIWQFLSALAVGASGIEQQRVLVSELR